MGLGRLGSFFLDILFFIYFFGSAWPPPYYYYMVLARTERVGREWEWEVIEKRRLEEL
jgi:hypothetical protein